ncbi:NHL domain-containing protein [Rhynchospora pubera]|uniref:NHL domain-containing protein n=1 Tax=Rhynchospora pubera TaxID=906938 RepID=A0AAV8GYV9_9POAL|nr:NHL domain-containing protein [Rhynchospora pubera]KAJ4808497.1 NHL domain-containing protein [Rhynchospora pubera]
MEMRPSLLLLLLSLFATLRFNAKASPSGDILKQLSSVVKWPKPPPKAAQTDGGHVLQFEKGYYVETLVEGDKLGVVPHTVRVSPEGELLAVDSIHNHIVRITPPLSEYSRGRLVAGSSQGYSGHVDGKPIDARFKHPKGVTMDDKGNVYVADTANMAIRKISEGGVTTIAGGKSNVAGYRDGPSEDAKFSSDFDLVFLKKTCSLLVIDRGNAALRQISLQQEDCDFQENSVLSSDLVLVIGAILAGYIFCLVQHYFSSLFAQKTKQEPEEEIEKTDATKEEPLVVESLTDEPIAGWPSFGTLLTDLFKSGVESIGNMLLNSVPLSLRRKKAKTDLTPLKDRLVMPEDNEETTPKTQKLKTPKPLSETIQTPIVQTTPITSNTIGADTPPKVTKSSKVPKLKDSSLSGKHRSSKRQDFAEFYGTGETGQVGSKGTKERVRHRHREKTGEVSFGQNETKPEYNDNARFDHYGSLRSKYGPESAYRY